MSVSIEDKQKSLYTALIRYSSAGSTLRERALEHLVLIALLETTEDSPLKVSDIRKNIGKGIGARGIRPEIVLETLASLGKQEQVKKTNIKHKSCYFITEVGLDKLHQMSKLSDNLLNPCIDRMLDASDFSTDNETVRLICKRFIINCFVLYGHSMAQTVTGELKHNSLNDFVNSERTFKKSVVDIKLEEDEKEDIYLRCLRFLKSNNKEDIEIKLLLTQAYYLGKILEVDSKDFDPLAESTFSGGKIYLDSNVIFDGLMSQEDDSFLEDLVDASSKLGMSLYVTQITIEEIDRVIRNKAPELQSIVNNLPSNLYHSTKDHLLNGFVDYLENNPDSTPEDFINSFGDIQIILESIGVVFEPLDIAVDFDSKEVSEVSALVDKAAKEFRPSGKSINVAQHDAVMLLHVKSIRSQGIKSWFLTKDSTLNEVSRKLSKNRALIFSLASFLQCVSPFVQGRDSDSLFKLFEKVLEDDASVSGVGGLFEVTELQIISEYYQDVTTTEPEKLHMAFEYVKSSYLNGKLINSDNQHKVHLEIKKFLRSSAEEQQLAVQQELERKNKLASDFQQELEEAISENSELTNENKLLETTIKNIQRTQKRKRTKDLLLFSLLFTFAAIGTYFLWQIDEFIYSSLLELEIIDDSFNKVYFLSSVETIVSIIFILFSLPLIFWFRSAVIISWFLGVLITLSLFQITLIKEEYLNTLTLFISIAGSIALLLTVFINNKE